MIKVGDLKAGAKFWHFGNLCRLKRIRTIQMQKFAEYEILNGDMIIGKSNAPVETIVEQYKGAK